MNTFANYRFTIFFLLLVLTFSCSKEETTIATPITFKNLDFDYNLNNLDVQFDNNVVQLGRVLFYDKELSSNKAVSCSSCHIQEFAFADTLAKSEGFLKGLTNRNTPNLLNTRFNNIFFWDGRTFSFPEAVTMPIFDHKEMGMTPEGLIKRLSNLHYYNDLFEKAFGNSKVTGTKISLALVEFVGSIISTDAKIDRFFNHETSLSQSEFSGLHIFAQHCNQCHAVLSDDTGERDSNNPYLGISGVSSPIFPGFTNNLVDIGLPFLLAVDSQQNQSLRIPTLRNIASTAPYMHDGRFRTLQEVIEHYDEGMVARPSIDERLLNEDGKPRQLGLTDQEKEHLISFLKTLSDPTVEQAEKFSDPF